MRTTGTNRRLRVLLTAIRDNKLLPRPEFQRRLVWSNKHKVAFIETVLSNYPFPEIYVAAGEVDPETGEGTEMLVDGQQRITTLYQYFTGSDELKLGTSIPPYSALLPEKKLEFLEYEVVVRDIGSVPIEEIKEVFQRINSTNYALNAMEVKNARYEGVLKSFAEELASDDFFGMHQIFSSTDVRRMNDLRFTLSLVITLISSYFNRDDAFEEFLERYNDEFELREVLNEEIHRVLEFVLACEFPSSCRVWKKADLFTLLVELHRALFGEKLPLRPTAVRSKLMSFYDEVDNSDDHISEMVAVYRRASIQATNDRGSRIRRGDIIGFLLKKSSQVQAVATGSTGSSD